MVANSVVRPRRRTRNAFRIERSLKRIRIDARRKASSGPDATTLSAAIFRCFCHAKEQILQRRPWRLVARSQLVDRPDGLQLAALDDRHAVAQLLRGVEQVR